MEFIVNNIVKTAMEDFRDGQSILGLSKETGISRITLTAWSRGQTPSLGVLLERYFTGSLQAHKLSYKLIYLLWPPIARMLPDSHIIHPNLNR